MAAECLGMKYWLGWQNQRYKLAGVFEWYHKIISSVDIIQQYIIQHTFYIIFYIMHFTKYIKFYRCTNLAKTHSKYNT